MDEISPRKVALVARNVSGLSGTATTVIQHLRYLAGQGAKVDIWSERIDKPLIRHMGGKGYKIPRFPFGKQTRRTFFSRAFEVLSQAKGYDLVFGHGDLVKQDILSLHNCVHDAHFAIHGRDLPASSAVGRFHSHMLGDPLHFKQMIANSWMMRRLISERYQIPQAKISVIYPGYNPKKFNAGDRERFRNATREQLQISPQHFLLGLITSGDFRKRGVDPFLEALTLLPSALRLNLQVIILGSHKNKTEYLRKLRKMELETKVRFLPPVTDVERYFHALDLYVHPALFEEFGQSVQEAMVCGIPTLTTHAVGATELLSEPGLRSLMLEGVTPQSIARGITTFIQDDNLRQKWRELTASDYSPNTWEENCKKTHQLMQALSEDASSAVR